LWWSVFSRDLDNNLIEIVGEACGHRIILRRLRIGVSDL